MSSVGAKVDQELDPISRVNYAECEKSIKDLLAQTPNSCTQVAFSILGGIMAGVCLASLPFISVHPIIGGVVAVVSAIVAAVSFARFGKGKSGDVFIELTIERKVNAIFLKVILSENGIATPEKLAFLDRNGHLCTQLILRHQPGVTFGRFCTWAINGGLPEAQNKIIHEHLKSLQDVRTIKSYVKLKSLSIAIRQANLLLNKNPPPPTDRILKRINDCYAGESDAAIVRKDLYEIIKRLPNLRHFSASLHLPENVYRLLEGKRDKMSICTAFDPNDETCPDGFVKDFPGLDESMPRRG